MLNLVQLSVLAAVARHGSMTAAAKELHYTQPAVSHHLARLEAATGAKLVQRIGRGIRLTPEGKLLAARAAEIVGRVEGAEAELAAQVGLRAGRVRLAGFQSILSTIVPGAATALAREHPGLELGLVDEHPGEALRMLREGRIDVALIFRYADTPREERGLRLVHLLEDPIYLLTSEPGQTIADHRESTWIGGCARCQDELVTICGRAGFTPRISMVSDDIVVMQALVAARMGVTTLPRLALRAHRMPGVHATELAEDPRQIYAVTYGDPPDPPAAVALIDALRASIRA
ncbi:DNA-binding transcriptional regulator, LysR family [Amycolatopsis lurida]|uniref:LysR family transcriptional regulator n=1 Tax=Amycolatopsis lurida NRRL 2430 TaxID=1460371 RepID=A0A2P2FGN7_AMYLU|nr:LysR family transcriptional regulator [Amycolatopsis lurida]KFU75849.1 LysR family transcriptional regulator [Amycolatopsis lurida NRRL 2430]SEE33497.1 DNA-binding transcriptional regulator, LysR family [Amycolatopsis lurida]